MTSPDQPAGRRPSKLSVALQNAVTRVHSFLYRISNGVIGGRVANSPVLLLTTTGRRSGKQRTVPLLYLMDGTQRRAGGFQWRRGKASHLVAQSANHV